MSTPTLPARQWIYERSGGAGGGGGPALPGAAPPVTITGASAPIKRENDLMEIDVSFKPNAAANKNNYTGVTVYVEDPDMSSGPQAPLDGSVPLDGTAQLGGQWNPFRMQDATESPVAVLIPAEDVDRDVRIYLAAYGPNSSPVLVRANDPTNTPTPSIVVTVPAQSLLYISGMEYAWLALNPSVQVNYFLNQVPQQYSFTYGFMPPSADQEAHRPPGLGPFTGCAIKMDYGAGVDNLVYAGDQKVTADDINAHRLITWTSDPRWNLTDSFEVIVYFVSESDSTLNSVVPGVTPSVNVSVTVPTGPGGGSGLAAPDVTGLVIVGTPSVEYQIDGSMLAIATFQWSLPSAQNGLVRYAGMDLYRVATTGSAPVPELIWSQTSATDATATVEIARIPSSPETWSIAAISVDFNGQLSDDPEGFGVAGSGFHSPWTTWTVGPPAPGVTGGGIEFAPLVTLNAGAMAAASESTSSDGVRQVSFALTGTGGAWTNPTSNQFGGAWVAMVVNGDLSHPIYWQVPQNATSFTTPPIPSPGTFGTPENVDFYILSQDPQGNRNHLVASVTPKISVTYTPTEGMIIPSRFNPSWFNQSEFAWDPSTNSFTTQSIGANKIQVGSILSVGGKNTFGGSQDGQIGVFDGSQNLIGWIGQQQGGQGASSWSIFGAWFKQLWVGGSAPAYAPLWVDQNGIVQVGGIAALSGAPYPYISVRDAYGVEMGRIGAQLTNPPAPGDGGAASTLPQGVTAGAWFTQLAAGGSSATNWQMLVANGSFYIRNTDLFELDFAPNTTTSPYNNQYVIQFGKSIWGGLGAGTTWQFPGFRIYEVDGTGNQPPNVFGSVFLNRGIVLRGTATQNYHVMAAFTLFNGDSAGSDFPPQFYGDLVMYSPTSPTIMNVHLSSGYVNAPGGPVIGDSIFYLWDRNGVSNFSVDGNGIVNVRGDITAKDYYVAGRGSPVIDSLGNWTGNPISVAPTGVASLSPGSLTGNVQLAAGANVSLTQSAQTITISSTGGGASSQTPWIQNIDANGNSLNNVLNIQSYNFTPGRGNTGYALTNNATGNTPGLGVYQDNGIIVAGAADTAPATNIQPANFLMTNNVGTQRILAQTNLGGTGSDYPVIGIGFTDGNSPGYIDIFAYGAQGFFRGSSVLAWEIRNGAKTGGAGQPSAGVLSGDIYLYNSSGTIVFQVSQGTVQAAAYGVYGTTGVSGSFTSADGHTITVTSGIITRIA